MSDRQDIPLTKRHSAYETQTQKDSVNTESICKSDLNIVLFNESANQSNIQDFPKNGEITSENSGCGEYYKKYEHDAMPVKDDSVSCDVTSTDSGNGDRIPLTESHLAKLEQNMFSSISHELPTSTSASTLDTNAKFFKTTVEEIFDKFYANMLDFELYKKRYQAILNKNREDSVEEMEDFIKDMLHHIMSSESSEFNASRLCQVTDKGTSVDTSQNSTHCVLLQNLHSVIEAFKNDNYLTDSTADEKGCASKRDKRKVNTEEVLSIYLLSGHPCVEIKMNNRKLLSEINFKESHFYRETGKQAASAEDIKKVAAKKLQMEKYEQQQNETYTPRHFPDRDIPVKISFAKKNIHLNEDFESNQNEKSFISRICNYLCKRLRKTSLV